jgi:hypothetical protein
MLSSRSGYLSTIFYKNIVGIQINHGLGGLASNPGTEKRFSLLQTVQTGSGATQYWGYFQGAKRTEPEVDRSPPSSIEVKNDWSHTSVPHLRLHDVDWDKFTF